MILSLFSDYFQPENILLATEENETLIKVSMT